MLSTKIDNEQIQLKLDGEVKDIIMDLCNLIILFCEEIENSTGAPSEKTYQVIKAVCDSHFKAQKKSEKEVNKDVRIYNRYICRRSFRYIYNGFDEIIRTSRQKNNSRRQ